MTTWVDGIVTEVVHWDEFLFTLKFRAPIEDFVAGQFTRVMIRTKTRSLQRAYSFVNAPRDEDREFYLVRIPGGRVSTALHALNVHDTITVRRQALGRFTVEGIAPRQCLWMLSTGTAVGPFLSMLAQQKRIDAFDTIVLVHAVRLSQHLNYLFRLRQLKKQYRGRLKVVTVVSREKISGALHGRIPQLIRDGTLEASVDVPIRPSSSHVMLCGNPSMVRDTRSVLKNRNMRDNLPHRPGHITSEQYW